MKIKTIFAAFAFSMALAVISNAQTAVPVPKDPPSSTASESAKISGKWDVTADAPGQSVSILIEFTQDGDKFTGQTASDLGGGTIDGGVMKDKAFSATMHADIQGQIVDFKMDGTLDGDKMSGTFSNAQFGSIPFSGSKAKSDK